MIVTGILLAMQYTADTELAFDSVERIMRDVNNGWLLRYIHMNGASMFFIIVFIHIFRGLTMDPTNILEKSYDAGRGNSSINDGYRFHGICTALGAMSFWGQLL